MLLDGCVVTWSETDPNHFLPTFVNTPIVYGRPGFRPEMVARVPETVAARPEVTAVGGLTPAMTLTRTWLDDDGFVKEIPTAVCLSAVICGFVATLTAFHVTVTFVVRPERTTTFDELAVGT